MSIDLFILISVILMGLFYYIFSTSSKDALKNYAFFIKMLLLIMSFILAFIKQDFIVIGTFAFGGRASVMMLILIEIMDAFIEKKNNSKHNH